jgi:hypothetical protein
MKKVVKKKTLNILFDSEVYLFQIMVSLGETDEQLIASLKKRKIPDPELVVEQAPLIGSGKCTCFPSGKILIRTQDYPSTPFDHGTIAHEVFHATCFILEKVGVGFRMDVSDESYAYLIGYITKKIYEKLDK